MSDLVLEPFDIRSAPAAAYEAIWRFDRLMQAERRPDDPPLPLESYIARSRSLPDFVVAEARLIRAPDGELDGFAGLFYATTAENAHLAQLDLEVRPQARRRGLGRRLLLWAAQTARGRGRRLLLGATEARVPAGAAFAEAAGARRGLEDRVSQLRLDEVDPALLAEWQARAAERATGFELLWWDGDYPEEHIEAFCRLCEVMNSAPHGEIEVEAERWTPERLRDWLRNRIAGGAEVWTLVARERSSGALAGFTELIHEPARPSILHQGATAVEPAYRNRGLGRWLKAAMLERVLRERADARFVRTGNAETNAPMLAINVALGFRPYAGRTLWQVEAERALAWAGG